LSETKYKRVLLKLSGEALAGEDGSGISPKVISQFAEDIKEAHESGVQIGIVIGGGNIFRGIAASAQGMDRASSDYMGMLATCINSLALQDALEKFNVDTRVQSAIEMNSISEPYIRRKDVLSKNLQVMDSTAISLCMDNKLPIRTFNLTVKGNTAKVINGEHIGTLVD